MINSHRGSFGEKERVRKRMEETKKREVMNKKMN